MLILQAIWTDENQRAFDGVESAGRQVIIHVNLSLHVQVPLQYKYCDIFGM